MTDITNAYPFACFNVTGPFDGVNPPIRTNSALVTGINCMVHNLTNANFEHQSMDIAFQLFVPGMAPGTPVV
jgi:hypothetical protein